MIYLGLGNQGLARQARLRRLSETCRAGVGDGGGGSEADGGQDIKYGYILSELFSSARHVRVPLEMRIEQLLVISAHYCNALRTWEPGDSIDEPPFVRRGKVVGRESLREVSTADAQAATPALSRRSAGQDTPAVRLLRPAAVEAGAGSNAEAAGHGALYAEAVECLAALLGQYEEPEEARSRLDASSSWRRARRRKLL